jgi:hypothetical protein
MVQQYNDILTRNAFGNYRTLLREMTVSPIMGTYLTLVNSKEGTGQCATKWSMSVDLPSREKFRIGQIPLKRQKFAGWEGRFTPPIRYAHCFNVFSSWIRVSSLVEW